MRLLMILAAGSLLAQSSDTPAVADWIRSAEPLQQAWAAHWIAEQHLIPLIPDLLRVLESPGASSDENAAKFAALDTLIRLDARVPADVPLADLEPLIDRFPTDVLILASRSTEDATAVFLKLLDRPHNREAFSIIGNLLAPKRVPGFAKAAMSDYCQHASIYVLNPDQSPGNIRGGWAGDTFILPDTERPGWPETGSYRLGGSSHDDHAVHFTRKVNRNYIDHGFDYSSEDSGDNICDDAAKFLEIYLNTSPSQLPIESQPEIQVIWINEPSFETSVRAFIARERRRYAVLAAQLAAGGYLTADQASQLRLNFKIQVEDERDHDFTALPDVTAWTKP